MASTLQPVASELLEPPVDVGIVGDHGDGAPVPVGGFDGRYRMPLVDAHHPAGELVVLAFERFNDEPGEVRTVWRRHDLDEASRAWRARTSGKAPEHIGLDVGDRVDGALDDSLRRASLCEVAAMEGDAQRTLDR